MSMNLGDKEGRFFRRASDSSVAIMSSLKEALVAAECDVSTGEGDRGIILCEDHIDALHQGCVLAVYLPNGHKLFIHYKPEHPPRTW